MLRSGLVLLVLGLAIPATASSNLSFRWTHYDSDRSGNATIVTFSSYSNQSLSLFGSANSFRTSQNQLTQYGGHFDRVETLFGNRVVGSSILRVGPTLTQFFSNHFSYHVDRYCPPRDHDAPIPEPTAALLFAVGAGIVTLRTRAQPRLA